MPFVNINHNGIWAKNQLNQSVAQLSISLVSSRVVARNWVLSEKIYKTRGSILEVKCGPMWKDQGVGTLVNNLLYLSLGYHLVFKVVRLKNKRVNCCLPRSRFCLVLQR